ncbi:hypothetical protein [Pseudomonas fluorescens]|uniref:hypothetical protein n=1 Tax=Pseudomonas fluorescens TaxID=294 RepID=UPI001781869B
MKVCLHILVGFMDKALDRIQLACAGKRTMGAPAMQHTKALLRSTHRSLERERSMDRCGPRDRSRGRWNAGRKIRRAVLKAFIDGTCLFLLVRPLLLQVTRGRSDVDVGNLEMTLLENIFYINQF